jgi:hypothetical protein
VEFGSPFTKSGYFQPDAMNNPVTNATSPAHPGSSRSAPADPQAERLLPTPQIKEKRSTKKRKLPLLVTPASTIHQDVVAALRNFIIRGELQPGARLPERALSERLKVSRTPLRESLRVLASEGLIELSPN